jgi:hypothetical protein
MASEVHPIYQIKVKGILDSKWSTWFDGFYITPLESGECILSGSAVDQSALIGLLLKIHELGLELLSFEIE